MLSLLTPESIGRECLAGRIRLLDHVLTRIYDDALKPFGLNVDRVSLLVALACSGGTGVADLSRFLHRDRSALGQDLDWLRERGWLGVAGGRADGTYHLSVTPEGHATLQRIGPAWRNAQVQAAKILGDRGVEAIREMTRDLWPQPESDRIRPPVPA